MANYRDGDVVHIKARIETQIAYGLPNDQAVQIVVIEGFDQAQKFGQFTLDQVVITEHEKAIKIGDRVSWYDEDSDICWGLVKAQLEINDRRLKTYLWILRDNGDMTTVELSDASRM